MCENYRQKVDFWTLVCILRRMFLFLGQGCILIILSCQRSFHQVKWVLCCPLHKTRTNHAHAEPDQTACLLVLSRDLCGVLHVPDPDVEHHGSHFKHHIILFSKRNLDKALLGDLNGRIFWLLEQNITHGRCG